MGRRERVVVVGAGFGGLAAAMELARRGLEVRVLERAEQPGGKAAGVRLGDADFDAGPTVLTMPWVFDELFERSGTAFRQAVELEPAVVLARHAWRDGMRLDLFADRARSKDALGEVFGASEARAFAAFCDETRRIYETVEAPFLRAQRPTVADLLRQVGSMGLMALGRIDALRSMARSLERRFASPRLRQLFGRYATYCGSSPYEAPATLNLVSHVEAEGVFRVRGGMRALAAAMATEARRAGAELTCGAGVEGIVVEGGRARGVRWAGGSIEADHVVFNGDVSALGEGLLGAAVKRAAPRTDASDRSLSAVTWVGRARAAGFPLVHHNVFFSDDYASEFRALVGERRMPAEPTVYVCAQDRGDVPEPREEERLLVLINAPATGDEPERWGTRESEQCERATRALLASCGMRWDSTPMRIATPVDFHRRYPATGGALYGPIARGSMSALSRMGSSSRIPGLLLAGGSVHPGPGVPMATLSGRLAAARILADLDSTARSRTAAITGTTSTA